VSFYILKPEKMGGGLARAAGRAPERLKVHLPGGPIRALSRGQPYRAIKCILYFIKV
jgi:hypothetical protein